jgi:putative flippase GtrA
MGAGALLRHLPSLRYLMVGAFCALLGILMQAIGVLVFGAHYALSTVVAFLILLPLSFYIHKTVTFQTQGPLSPKRFLLYTLQWSAMLVVNIGLLALFVDVLHLHVGLAIPLVTLIIHVITFLYSRSYVFREGG